MTSTRKFKSLVNSVAKATFLSTLVILTISSSLAFAEEEINLIPNPSAEIADVADPTMPKDWEDNFWGDLDVTFSNPKEGQSGSKSLRIEVHSGTEGDAKWWTRPIDLIEDQWIYEISDYYRSNVSTRIMAYTTNEEGANKWLTIMTLEPADDWTYAKSHITFPEDTVDVRIFHVIAKPGWLDTDTYVMKPTEDPDPPENQAKVSLAFDDGWTTFYVHALPIMDEFDMKGTHFIHAEYVDKPGYQADYMVSSQIEEMANNGHEIGSHALFHLELANESAETIEHHTTESKKILEEFGFDVVGFAPPGGSTNQTVADIVSEDYEYLRTVISGLNYEPYDMYNLKCVIVTDTMTFDDVKYWIDKAAEDGGWLILVFHRFSDEPPSESFYKPTDFRKILFYLQEIQARVEPMGKILDVWEPTYVDPNEGLSEIKSLSLPELPEGTDNGSGANGDNTIEVHEGGCQQSNGTSIGLFVVGLVFLILFRRRNSAIER